MLLQHCCRCAGSPDPRGIAASCEALACPVLSRRRHATRLLGSATRDLGDYLVELELKASVQNERAAAKELADSSVALENHSSAVIDLLHS